MNLGEAFEEVTGNALGFVELSGTDEVDGRIGCGREFVGVVLEPDERLDVRRSCLAKVCGVRGSASRSACCSAAR